MPRIRQNPKEKCVLIAKSSALSTFDLASACLGAVRRWAGGSQADSSGLPGAQNSRGRSNLADVGLSIILGIKLKGRPAASFARRQPKAEPLKKTFLDRQHRNKLSKFENCKGNSLA